MIRLLFLFIMLVTQTLWAQYNELGLFAGGANAVTDIGKAVYVNPNKWAIGILYKRNLHTRLSFRADLKYLTLWDNDAQSDIVARQNRGFSFENEVIEIGAGIEYNFLDFDTHQPFDVLFTPYFHTGIYYFEQNYLQFQNLTTTPQTALVSKKEPIGTWAIPFTLGIKTRLGNTRFLLGAEVSARYTFSNNLEGSKPNDSSKRFGNFNNNDWYFVSGLYITYTFGQKPCDCF